MAADAPGPDGGSPGEAASGGDADSNDGGPTDVPHPAFAAYAGESVPGAAVGSPGKEGRLELTFATDADGATVLRRDLARVPFHVSGTLDHDPHPDGTAVYVQSPNGGMAQGDRHEIEIEAGTEAVATVATGSATKVLSMERNYGAADVSLSVDAGGHLAYVPEPTILHEDARYCQTLSLDVAADATAVVGEVVVPGRLARDERFAFDRYASRLEIRGPDGLLATDATHLSPPEGDDGNRDGTVSPSAPGVLGEFEVYGAIYLVAPAANEAELSDRVHAAVADERAWAGATTLPNGAGVVVRALGDRAGPVTETLHAAWDAARTELLDYPAPPRRQQ